MSNEEQHHLENENSPNQNQSHPVYKKKLNRHKTIRYRQNVNPKNESSVSETLALSKLSKQGKQMVRFLFQLSASIVSVVYTSLKPLIFILKIR